MAWIESHQILRYHHKVFDLAERMGWSVRETIGVLHLFWWWVADCAEDGDLRKFNDAALARCVDLSGEQSKSFVAAMVAARWLDREPYFRVHDWWTYFGRFLQVKYKSDPHKWMTIRADYLEGVPSVPVSADGTNRKMGKWSHAVQERDGKVCQICDKSDGQLHAHHIKRQRDFPSLIFEEWNGITLCRKCHKSLQGKEKQHEYRLLEIVLRKYPVSEQESIKKVIRKVCIPNQTKPNLTKPKKLLRKPVNPVNPVDNSQNHLKGQDPRPVGTLRRVHEGRDDASEGSVSLGSGPDSERRKGLCQHPDGPCNLSTEGHETGLCAWHRHLAEPTAPAIPSLKYFTFWAQDWMPFGSLTPPVEVLWAMSHGHLPLDPTQPVGT